MEYVLEYSAHKYGQRFSARKKEKKIIKIATQKVARISYVWGFYYSISYNIQTHIKLNLICEQMNFQ